MAIPISPMSMATPARDRLRRQRQDDRAWQAAGYAIRVEE
jgi:hypothetical protein